MALKKKIIVKTCDYCGSETTQFAITANHLVFCNEGYIGKTTKDCHEKYLLERMLKNVRTKQLQKEKAEEARKKEKELQEKKVRGYKTANKKLKSLYDQFKTPYSKRSYL